MEKLNLSAVEISPFGSKNTACPAFLSKMLGCSFPACFISVFLYRFCLDILYAVVISPLYSYSYSDFSCRFIVLPYVCSLLALMVFVPFVIRVNQDESPSSLLITLLNYMFFIPLTSLYGCKGTLSSNFFVIALLYWALLLFWQLRIPVLSLTHPDTHNSKKFFSILTLVSCAFVLIISYKYTGLRFTLDIINVYDIRAEAAEYEMSSMVSYILGCMPLVLSVSIVYWLRAKKYIITLLIAVVYIFLFSIAGNKSYFFMLVLVLGVHIFFMHWMYKSIPPLLCALCLIALIEYLILDSFMISSLFVRRMMLVPVAHSESFYHFFSKNPVNLFRDGIMGKFSFDSIYQQNIPRLIGEFQEEYAMNANNGLLGDMFANLPVLLGLVLLPLILVICFRVMDLTAKGLDLKLLLPFAIYFANSFINSSWSTVLLTHGFLLTCLIFFIYPREEEELRCEAF